MTSGTRGPGGWRPLLQVPHVTWLGEYEGEEGRLWIGSDLSAQRELDLDRPVAALPLLERPYLEVLDELGCATELRGADTREALSRVVPAGVIETALHMGSEYWLRHACVWVEALSPSARTLDWACRLETATAASQSTRHLARRLRRRWSSAVAS